MNTSGILRWAHVVLLFPALLMGCALPKNQTASGPAATVERIEIVNRKPAFGGTRFGDVGEYELVVAVAHVKVDPRHSANQRIIDLAAAADPDGMVRYRTDVVILRPREADKASSVLVFDVATAAAS